MVNPLDGEDLHLVRVRVRGYIATPTSAPDQGGAIAGLGGNVAIVLGMQGSLFEMFVELFELIIRNPTNTHN